MPKETSLPEAIRSFVVVKLEVAAVHQWPECNLEGVEFLKDLHRHIFKIKVRKWVSHLDREIEIIKLKDELNRHIAKKYPLHSTTDMRNFGRSSCEAIAMDLMQTFKLATCEVLEDGENGALLSNV